MSLFTDSQKVVFPTTKDYDAFKILLGNREINQQKVESLAEDMKLNGVHADCVIKVNEKGEIIDGQHRFMALKMLDASIPYMVLPNANVKDCVQMNANQSPWKLIDFIYSGATSGNQNYRSLLAITKEFPLVPISTVLKIITRRVTGIATAGKASKSIRNWSFYFPEEYYGIIAEELEYISQFEFVRAKNKHGNSDIFYNAIATCYECPMIDNNRLLERMTDSNERFGAFNTFKECLDRIQEVYNLYSRKQRVYLAHEVQQMLDTQKHNVKKEVND